ncbi:MAG: amino acid permease [Bacteroidetes bacterium]|nr:MAG: amino acid permease [Bacteroidota bacterium]
MRNKIGIQTAVAVVVANMIGTGVFTSLGFQLADIQSVFVILMLWLVGGITALCGALTYGELGAALPRSGGEYHFLSSIYHPSIGFVAGWVSATVGFAAPTALVAMTFGEYLEGAFPQLNKTWLAVGLLLLIAAVHTQSLQSGGRFQRLFTAMKVLLILAFIGLAFVFDQPQPLSLLPRPEDLSMLFSPAFAVSLIYVSYAFTGWNAATYLINELKHPRRNLPLALLAGTAVVAVLYLLLNYAFMRAAPTDALVGKVEVGYIAAVYMLGPEGGKWMSLLLAMLLISTASAMIFAGPRVLMVMGEDLRMFRFLSKKNARGVPATAILFQSVLSLLFVLTGSFKAVLLYAGFVLAATTFVTVAGVYVLRIRQPQLPRPYKTWGYPFTPFIYLLLVGWTLVFLLVREPRESLSGLATLLAGWLIYQLGRKGKLW